MCAASARNIGTSARLLVVADTGLTVGSSVAPGKTIAEMIAATHTAGRSR
jgi:hypothetical protein